ncbi:putative ribonuclease H-like domain-containing protein [Tanacetum coccineum]
MLNKMQVQKEIIDAGESDKNMKSAQDMFCTANCACYSSHILQSLKTMIRIRFKRGRQVDAMQEELLQFEIQKVWVLVDLPYGKKAIGTKWVYRNKKDERGVVVRNKASAFLYGKIDEEVYVSQPPGFLDPKHPQKVYKVVKALYGLHQAPRACSRLWDDTSLGLQRNLGVMSFEALIRVDFKWSFKWEKLTFFLDYSQTNTRWKKIPYREAEYVAAASCCGQVLWIQNQMLDYGFNFMNTKIYIDNESTICIVKNPVYHSKTKHIAIRHHFIRDAYEKKLIQVLKRNSSGVHTLVTKEGVVIHMLVEKKYPLRKEVLMHMLKLKLESEEDSTMALELIRFIKKLLAELEPEEKG